MKLIAILMIFMGFLAGSGWASAGSPSPTPQAKTANSSASLFQSGVSAYERKNYPVALKIFTELAEQGLAQAQHFLGLMYVMGKGVPKDYVHAAKCFYLAKANGEMKADEAIQLVEPKMSHQQIEQAQALATEWWQNHH